MELFSSWAFNHLVLEQMQQFAAVPWYNLNGFGRYAKKCLATRITDYHMDVCCHAYTSIQ